MHAGYLTLTHGHSGHLHVQVLLLALVASLLMIIRRFFLNLSCVLLITPIKKIKKGE